MTYGQIKQSILALIDEYTTEIVNYTEDEDILGKLPVLINLANRELAGISKIIATKIYSEVEEKENKYSEYRLPSNLAQVKEVYVLDKDNRKQNADFYFMGKDKIFINDKTNGKTILEYYKTPLMITEETEDDFTMEIDEDAQQVLPYKVADDILKTDPSANYIAFANEYQRQLQLLDTRRNIPMVTLVPYEEDTTGDFDI